MAEEEYCGAAEQLCRMHELFVDRLREAGRLFTVVSGAPAARVKAAVGVIDQVMASMRY